MKKKTEIFSEVTGHASLVKGKVFVSSVFEVPADVDNSIGNVEYAGNVHVAGNVKGGFEVRAKGDIIVEGVVEDALLEAGGQIIVKRGIHGMGKKAIFRQIAILYVSLSKMRLYHPEDLWRQVPFCTAVYQRRVRYMSAERKGLLPEE